MPNESPNNVILSNQTMTQPVNPILASVTGQEGFEPALTDDEVESIAKRKFNRPKSHELAFRQIVGFACVGIMRLMASKHAPTALGTMVQVLRLATRVPSLGLRSSVAQDVKVADCCDTVMRHGIAELAHSGMSDEEVAEVVGSIDSKTIAKFFGETDDE